MKTKTRLISLMLAGSIATAGLTACSSGVETLSVNCDERKHLSIETSLDAGQQIKNVESFDLVIDGEKYYVKFLGHYDEGYKNVGRYSQEYIEHKDYIVIYEISQDEYRTIAKFYNNANNKIRLLTLDNLAVLQGIVDTYDPISVEENTIDCNGRLDHSY